MNRILVVEVSTLGNCCFPVEKLSFRVLTFDRNSLEYKETLRFLLSFKLFFYVK